MSVLSVVNNVFLALFWCAIAGFMDVLVVRGLWRGEIRPGLGLGMLVSEVLALLLLGLINWNALQSIVFVVNPRARPPRRPDRTPSRITQRGDPGRRSAGDGGTGGRVFSPVIRPGPNAEVVLSIHGFRRHGLAGAQYRVNDELGEQVSLTVGAEALVLEGWGEKAKGRVRLPFDEIRLIRVGTIPQLWNARGGSPRPTGWVSELRYLSITDRRGRRFFFYVPPSERDRYRHAMDSLGRRLADVPGVTVLGPGKPLPTLAVMLLASAPAVWWLVWTGVTLAGWRDRSPTPDDLRFFVATQAIAASIALVAYLLRERWTAIGAERGDPGTLLRAWS